MNDQRQSFNLWPHQIEALAMARTYLASRETDSALVSMPTGTGKSAIIAALACSDEQPFTVVLTPWRFLCRQMSDYLDRRFWEDVVDGEKEDHWSGQVGQLLPSSIVQTLGTTQTRPIVLIGTTTALQIIHANLPAAYEALRRRVSLVLVDEGHREPAPEWAKAVRGLGAPTVLFTATPYRNDFHLFSVTEDHTFRYSHDRAVKDRFIRGVRFEPLHKGTDVGSFVQSLLSYTDGSFERVRPMKGTGPRVLIRCETYQQVVEVAQAISRAGRTVVGVHDRFANDPPLFWNHVPSPDDVTDVEFWVHQWKLLEGVDDAHFSLLAIFGEFRNARSLVQQVGRIVRNPGQKARQNAVVLFDPTARPDQRALWESYLAYDRSDPAASPEFQLPRFLASYLALMPSDYVGGTFRRPMSLDGRPKGSTLNLRASATVYNVDKSFSIDACQDSVTDAWRDLEDVHQLSVEMSDDQTRLHLYVYIAQSPLLGTESFLEPRLGCTVYHQVGNLLFYQDTNGLTPPYLENQAQATQESLRRLVGGPSVRLTRLSARNSDISNHAIRARSIHAYSIAETAPSLAEHAEFVTTADGYVASENGRGTRRYVGLTRARVSEPSTFESLADYCRWLDEVAHVMRSGAKPSLVFDRFADPTSRPDDPEPVNILVDLGDAARSFRKTLDGAALDIEDSCLDVTDGRFPLRCNGADYVVDITYDDRLDRYQLLSPLLEAGFALHDGSEVGSRLLTSLPGYLNREQAFRVVPATPGFMYSHGDWYAPRNRFTAGDVMTGVPQLGASRAGVDGRTFREVRAWLKGGAGTPWRASLGAPASMTPGVDSSRRRFRVA